MGRSLQQASPYPRGMLDLAELCSSTESNSPPVPQGAAHGAGPSHSPLRQLSGPPVSPLTTMSTATPLAVPAAAELLEKQPQLGLCTGATLLRILQIVAGGVSIAHVAHEPDRATPAPPRPTSSRHSNARYLDGFFEHYHPQYPIVHKATFLAQWAHVIPRPPKESWDMLSNVVLGLGAFCIGAPMSAVDELLGRAFGHVRVDVFETLLSQGEADVRVPQDVSNDVFTPQAQSDFAAIVGATNYTSLVHQARFCLLSNRIYTRVIGTPSLTSAQSLALDDELSQWDAASPVCLSGPWNGRAEPVAEGEPSSAAVEFSVHKLSWRYSNLQIILYRRAFLEQGTKRQPLSTLGGMGVDPDAECAERCLAAATRSIASIKTFFETRTPSRLETRYGLHFLFQSAFVPLIALHAEAVLNSLQDDALARRCLRIMSLLGPHDLHLGIDADAPLQPERSSESAQKPSSWFDNWNPMSQDLPPFADATTLASFWPFDSELPP
ncbi:hypothetical protein Q5752_001420 [Cryptotrichosporon argae]